MSDTSVLTAESREGRGKGPARRLRAKGLIPAVVYGLAKAPSHLAVDPKLLEQAIATPRRFNTLITLKTGDGEKLVLFKDYQVDPVSRTLLHADFLEVSLDEPVTVEVPVEATGKAEGVVQGGILTISAHEVVLEALPAKIPVKVEVDVTPIKIGQSIHISEVRAPEGCKIKYATDYVVAFVAVPEKEEVVAPVAAVPGVEAAVPGAPPVPGAPAPAPGAAAPAAGAAPPAAGAAAPAAGAKPAPGAPPAKGAEGRGPPRGKK
ncbi:MAG TPA: 50S ribosomal protein L25/general stress protein Ctc [Anaeromyxobacteraceae bacterium]|jgi:large subunit ribosomal protein L25